jgi:hypothetical protein
LSRHIAVTPVSAQNSTQREMTWYYHSGQVMGLFQFGCWIYLVATSRNSFQTGQSHNPIKKSTVTMTWNARGFYRINVLPKMWKVNVSYYVT